MIRTPEPSLMDWQLLGLDGQLMSSMSFVKIVFLTCCPLFLMCSRWKHGGGSGGTHPTSHTGLMSASLHDESSAKRDGSEQNGRFEHPFLGVPHACVASWTHGTYGVRMVHLSPSILGARGLSQWANSCGLKLWGLV